MQDDLRILLRGGNVINRVPDNSALLREGDEAAESQKGAELAVVHLVNADESGDPQLVDSSTGLYVKVGTTLDGTSRNKIARVPAAYVTTSGLRPDQRELNNADVDYTGSFWFRKDTKALSLNITGEHNSNAWYDLTPRYTNLNEVPEAIGSIAVGDTFDNVLVSDVLDSLLYPYTTPTIATFTITPNPAATPELEVGQSIIPPGGTNYRVMSVTLGTSSNLGSIFYYAGTDLNALEEASNVFAGGFYTQVGNVRTFTYEQSLNFSYPNPETFYWRSAAVDSNGDTHLGPYKSVSWKYRSYVVVSPLDNITDPTSVLSGVTSSLSRLATASKAATLNPEYIYVFLPVGREPGGFFVEDGYAPYTAIQINQGGSSAMAPVDQVTITRNSVPVVYNVYRTAYPTCAALTLTLI